MPSIAEILHHFGRAKGCLEDASWSPIVQSAKTSRVCRIARANDGHRRLQEISYGATFAHELGINTHAKITSEAFPTGVLNCRNHELFRSPRQHGAAQNNEVKGFLVPERLGDAPAHWFQMAEVEFAAAQAGCSDAQQ